jgi:hypothetical protein
MIDGIIIKTQEFITLSLLMMLQPSPKTSCQARNQGSMPEHTTHHKYHDNLARATSVGYKIGLEIEEKLTVPSVLQKHSWNSLFTPNFYSRKQNINQTKN